MTNQETKLLNALAWMCQQYLARGTDDFLCHDCMAAGQQAVALLAEYGLVEPETIVGGRWTEAGKQFLDQSFQFD